tara:strand:- start:1094 stop:1402 length:309 start_codon:yes stop_codon:yes gene_type:complete
VCDVLWRPLWPLFFAEKSCVFMGELRSKLMRFVFCCTRFGHVFVFVFFALLFEKIAWVFHGFLLFIIGLGVVFAIFLACYLLSIFTGKVARYKLGERHEFRF